MGSVVFEVFTLKTTGYTGFKKVPGSKRGSNVSPPHLSKR